MKHLRADFEKHWLKIAVVGFFSLMVMLFNQQNMLIAGQGDKFKADCKRIEKGLDSKVDNKVLLEMIRAQDRERQDNKEKWVKQDTVNGEMLKSIQELNVNVILLNEKLE